MQNRIGRLFLVALLAATCAAFGQGTPAALPTPVRLTFDVASVRPAPPMDRDTLLASLRAGRLPQSMHIEGLRATFTYMSLKELIGYAYKVRPYQITGPDWMVTDRFDIQARLPEGATRDDVPAMLQAVLVERFKLATHMETKEHPVLGLMIGKAGSKLKPVPPPAALDETAPLQPGETKADSIDGPMRLSKNPDGSTTYNMGANGIVTVAIDGENGSMHLVAPSMTLRGFAGLLTSLGNGGRQIVDMTNLPGNYQFAVDFSLSDLVSNLRDQGIEIPGRPGDTSPASSEPTGTSTVSDALAKLGLRMEKTKAVTGQLIVDHVEKVASEN